jgi:hydrogenase nickel incorporation protein HypA/HybF
MHEMSIVLNIFDIVMKQLSTQFDKKNPKVKKVTLIVGKMSTVVPEALDFSFHIAKKDTIFDDAELQIKEVPVEGECSKCKATFSIEDPLFLCPRCENPDITITKGRELFIESIDIED